jgi:hypothetical protein
MRIIKSVLNAENAYYYLLQIVSSFLLCDTRILNESDSNFTCRFDMRVKIGLSLPDRKNINSVSKQTYEQNIWI